MKRIWCLMLVTASLYGSDQKPTTIPQAWWETPLAQKWAPWISLGIGTCGVLAQSKRIDQLIKANPVLARNIVIGMGNAALFYAASQAYKTYHHKNLYAPQVTPIKKD